MTERTEFSGKAWILCADDEETSLLLFQRILEQAGYGFIGVSQGDKVLEASLDGSPDLILLDVMMPGMGGFEVFNALREDSRTMDIPVVFITALNDREHKVQGLRMGGLDYITKPFEYEEVLARIGNLIRLRTAMVLLERSQEERLQALRRGHSPFLTDPRTLADSRCEVWYQPSSGSPGGDQYDIVRLGEGVFAYFLADISGHGLETSYHSTVLKTLFRENILLNDNLSQTFHRLNRVMKGYLDEGQFITAVLLVINRNTSSVAMVSAGHHPVLAADKDGKVIRLKPEGDPLGAWASPKFEVYQGEFHKGTRFWFCTDGALEDFSGNRSASRGLKSFESILKDLPRNLDREDALGVVRQLLIQDQNGEDDRVLMVAEL